MFEFHKEPIKLHSGSLTQFKIECDSLTVHDWEALAEIVVRNISFSAVFGIPNGGLMFESALAKHVSLCDTILIVDDVLTTGKSMNEFAEHIRSRINSYVKVVGVVAFARGKCPDWITPVFTMSMPIL